jgi:ABC-2 type transport system ATP-binding protein
VKTIRPQVYSSDDFRCFVRHCLSSFVYEAGGYLLEFVIITHYYLAFTANYSIALYRLSRLFAVFTFQSIVYLLLFFMNALSIRQLKKTYKNGFEALKGIDLDVEAGDFFALLGPNGAGKSTAIGIISSLVTASSGTVSIFGHDLKKDLAGAKSCLGLVPQEVNFNQFDTVRSIILNQAGYYGTPKKLALERMEYFLKQMDLWDKRDTISRRLSGGMKRRVMIARAMVHAPKLLILDEPTAGVDIEIRRSMWQMMQEVNQQGTTIILTTHYLE